MLTFLLRLAALLAHCVLVLPSDAALMPEGGQLGVTYRVTALVTLYSFAATHTAQQGYDGGITITGQASEELYCLLS